MTKVAVVALGGNAFTVEQQSGTHEEQAANATAMAHCICELLDEGWRLALVHGNGPQVGNLAIQQEESAALLPPQPLFSLVAMTQGQLGSIIASAVHAASGGRHRVVTVLAHVVVDAADPAMAHPTKPIGPFLDGAEAKRLAQTKGWRVEPDSGRGYRRVVASPQPQSIVEVDAVACLLDAGHVVVTAGGGGIPVLRDDAGRLTGVNAVIDKDYAAATLALALGAQALVLVTAVEAVYLDYGTATQRRLAQIDLTQADAYLAAGQFPDGSMGPKIRAATRFLRSGGEIAVITNPALAAASLRGADPENVSLGTRIVNLGPR
ncbi:MAG TPA: carbamate kinase [Jatrophihabitantaceae bacterium]